MIADRIENLGKYESYEPEIGAVRAFCLRTIRKRLRREDTK